MVSDARSEPASGSLNSWHQVISPWRVGRTQRCLLGGGAVDGDGGGGPGAHLQVGHPDPGPAELLVDHDLLDGAGATSPGPVPVGDQEPRVREPAPPLAGREGGDALDLGPDPRPPGLGLGRQGEGEVAAGAAERGAGRGRPPGGVAAEQLAERQRPAEVQVGIVLPREPDAAQHLDAVLGNGDEGVEGDGAGGGDRDAGAGVAGIAGVLAVERGGGIPGHGPGLLGQHEHVGAAVLHGLELADGPAELAAVAGVGGGGVDAPGGAAGGLRRRQRDADGLDPGPGEPGQRGGGRTVERQAGETTGGVEGVDRSGGDGGAVDGGPPLRPSDRGRDDHDVGQRAAQHRAGGAGEAERAVVAAGALDAAGQRDRADPAAGGQVGPQVSSHERGRPHGGQHRARRHHPAQLLDHDRQLGEAVALAPVGLGDGQPEPAQRGQVGPERRQRPAARLHRGAGHGGRAAVGGEAAGTRQEREVVVTDRDAHEPLPRLTIMSG